MEYNYGCAIIMSNEEMNIMRDANLNIYNEVRRRMAREVANKLADELVDKLLITMEPLSAPGIRFSTRITIKIGEER